MGHMLLRNCLLKHVIEGKIEGRTLVTGRRGRRCKQLLYDLTKRVLEFKRGSTKSHSVENSLWKRLWTCSKTDCEMTVVCGSELCDCVEGGRYSGHLNDSGVCAGFCSMDLVATPFQIVYTGFRTKPVTCVINARFLSGE